MSARDALFERPRTMRVVAQQFQIVSWRLAIRGRFEVDSELLYGADRDFGWVLRLAILRLLVSGRVEKRPCELVSS